MTRHIAEATDFRLSAQPGETIDRGAPLHFTFNGKRYEGYEGDTIASALAASGVRVFSRSFKYHRPRGLLCCAGHCPNCLVQVGPEPSVRACMRPVEDGMQVISQNTWPSLENDVMALTSLGDRFLPVGFYYKAFIHPASLWPAYERLLRSVAGLGKIDPSTPPGDYDKQYLHTDVAVVGGGPAGLGAALAAAGRGAQVALFDENPALGGHTLYAEEDDAATAELIRAINGEASISVHSNTTVLGWFEDNWLFAVGPRTTTPRRDGARLFKIRAGAVVFATGVYEQPLLFDNNDLPGVMLAGAARRLVRRYGVLPGSTAVVITANDDGWETAAVLQRAGASLAGVVDLRPSGAGQERMLQPGVPVYFGHTITGASGGKQVQEVTVAPLDAQGLPDETRQKRITCDLVVVGVGYAPANGLLYQVGSAIAFDEHRGEFLPRDTPPGIFAAGRVNGAHSAAVSIADGRLAGLQAAAFLGLSPEPDIEAVALVVEQRAAEPVRTSTLAKVPGRSKQILCYCEDVTDKDLHTAIAEGYDNLELLKRYSTISMGPCQGKMCSQNALHLCARANDLAPSETGVTTARPPMTPVSLGALAGRNMEPVQITPVHELHLRRGARMMVAGLWLRPEHYGDPAAEVKAVREAVGLIDVSTLGKLRLTGPGVSELLNRLYVNRWDGLAVGRVRYGVMCNDEGVVLDDGVTARVNEREWYTTTTSSGTGAIFEWIQWWVQSGWGEGVHVANVTEAYAAFNLAGPLAREVLQRLTDADLSNAAFPYMHVREINLAGVACRILRIGFTGELSYEIHCPAGYAAYLWELVLETGKPFGIQPFGVEAQRILRLEKAHIIVGQDTDGLSDPLSADMAWAVKLDKEDFLGKRALTRVSADGPRQRLVGFKMVSPGIVPDEGLQIVRPNNNGRRNGQQYDIIGWVTSSRHSPTLNETIGLCWLPSELAEKAGQEFVIRLNGRLERACVHHGPFYDPEGKRLRL